MSKIIWFCENKETVYQREGESMSLDDYGDEIAFEFYEAAETAVAVAISTTVASAGFSPHEMKYDDSYKNWNGGKHYANSIIYSDDNDDETERLIAVGFKAGRKAVAEMEARLLKETSE
jgi:hypothetical protein